MDMHTQQEKASILLIYTGGTIGMIENPETGVLESFNFQHLKDNMPELKKLGYSVATIQFDPPMDSSEMGPDSWMKIVKIIADNYQKYDGFVPSAILSVLAGFRRRAPWAQFFSAPSFSRRKSGRSQRFLSAKNVPKASAFKSAACGFSFFQRHPC